MNASKQSLDGSAANYINAKYGAELSRATSPGGDPQEVNGVSFESDYKKTRNRPRTYPYFNTLPYAVEDEAQRQKNLTEILKHLYIAIQAGDYTPGAIHWTRELRSWLSLKFDPTKEQRVILVNLYYELALAPGIEPGASERFSSMFMLLTK
jgi:proteasome activator subunit 4